MPSLLSRRPRQEHRCQSSVHRPEENISVCCDPVIIHVSCMSLVLCTSKAPEKSHNPRVSFVSLCPLACTQWKEVLNEILGRGTWEDLGGLS